MLHVAAETRAPEFSYVRLSDNRAKVTCTCGWEDQPMPVSPFDPNEALAAAQAAHPRCHVRESVNTRLHYDDLQHELTQKALAWSRADRICDDLSATLTRIEDEIDVHLQNGQTPPDLLGKLEHAKVNFQLADQRAQKCDEEFRQVARQLADLLEAPK